MYKFETHLHTCSCSACAVSTAEEMIDAAFQNGYSGMVITNHFYRGNTCIDRSLSWESFVDAYQRDYEKARKYGDKKGIVVFFGLEDGYGKGKEFLIYGVTPEDIKNIKDYPKLSLKYRVERIHELGGICICAHPFRDRAYIEDPNTPPDAELFDGIEGFNSGNAPHENTKAFAFAFNNEKIVTSGGDVHDAKRFGEAGVSFDRPIKDYSDFTARIKSGDFKVIVPQ